MKYYEQVYEWVCKIPVGRVATYGQIASTLGNPRNARVVGYALRRLTTDDRIIPWWRVVNAKGYISIDHGFGGIERAIQADLLRDEGVEIDEDLSFDINRYLWDGK